MDTTYCYTNVNDTVELSLLIEYEWQTTLTGHGNTHTYTHNNA